MSKIGAIRLLGDSAVALPGFDTGSTPYISIKTSEALWNGMQTEDPSDTAGRRLFERNAEINPKTSGLISNPRWLWSDFVADQSVDSDAMFIFAPHELIFAQQHEEVVKSMVLQKTHYSEFLRRHDRRSGKIGVFEIKTDNWFAGTGLVMWQCQQLLKKLDANKTVSLTQLKAAFDKLSKRTRTLSIMSATQINPSIKNLILEESLMGRLTGSLSKSKWVTFQLGFQQSDTSDKDLLNTQIDAALKSIIKTIENKQLGFARIIISCSLEQMSLLKANGNFLQFDRMQQAFGFKWIHQPAPIASQILTGKDAIHFSYAVK